MIRPSLILLVIFLLATDIQLSLQPGDGEVHDLSRFCPLAGEAGPWRPAGSLRQVEGEDLFLLINGGAEIYHEYGFYRALTTAYEDPTGRKINMEIFEMKDDSAAFGIYSFKTAAGAKMVAVGDEALLEDYYLNMWQGNFLVTLIGFDSGEETVAGLVVLARATAARIKVRGRKPELLALLPPVGLAIGGTTYLSGPLGLFNKLGLFSEDIFGIEEGILGHYPDYKLLVLTYRTIADRQHWFTHAAFRIGKKAGRESLSLQGDGFTFNASPGLPVRAKAYRNYIFLVAGGSQERAVSLFEKIESSIRQPGRRVE